VKPLADLVVVELAGSIAGAYCAKLFADAGARVVVLGDDTLTAHQRAYLHRGKEQAATFALDTADVVIESSQPEPLACRFDRTDDSPVIHVQVSPFGSSGPQAQWRSTDLTDYAASGHLYLYGDPAREPLVGPANQPAYASGLFAFIGAMSALLARERLGSGQSVEISHVESMVALHQFTLIRYLMSGDVLARMGNRFTGQGQPNGLYPCADGWIAISAPADHQVEFLLAATGLTNLLAHPCIESPLDFQNFPQLIDNALTGWLADKGRVETTELFQTMRIPTGPALSMLELLDDPQLRDRGYFEEHDGIQHPRPPHLVTPAVSTGSGWAPGPVSEGPLAGLRVLDLTRVWAGPLATRVMADLGADVVWVEAPWSRGPKKIPNSMVQATRCFPDDDPGDEQWNRNAHIVKFALGKRSLAIDLDTDDGREAFEELVASCDVIIENYSPRVMPHLGLAEERIRELNPDALYVTMPGFGRSGPARDWVAYGSSVDTHAGLSSLIGYHDRTPWKSGVAWPDPIAGLHATSAILMQLWAGQVDSSAGAATIELAQLESMIAALGDRVVEAQVSDTCSPTGNRDAAMVVQGVYPCAGDDAWVAVAVIDESSGRALCDHVGLASAVLEDHDAFDAAFAAWTGSRDAAAIAIELQALGIAAAAVSDAPAVLADPQFVARDLFVTVDQPGVGPFTVPITPIRLSHTPPVVRRPAPRLGEHNDEVLTGLAGLAADDIASLHAAGVIVNEPPN